MPEENAGGGSPGRQTGLSGDDSRTWADSGARERELNQNLRHMASLARHDINNQLTIISGYLSLMQTGSPALKNDEIIRVLQGAAERIGLILRFTREYQDIGAEPPVWQDLAEVLGAARSSLDTGAVRPEIADSCRGVRILADPLFPRVFAGLIDNSLRHGKGVTVFRVSCHPAGGSLEIVYEDNGCGIDGSIRPVLFEPGKGKKTGYGLFIIRGILKMTGLSIAETGEPQNGARFVIGVPAGSFRIP